MTKITRKAISLILVDVLFYLEVSDDSKVDPDYALSIMEDVSASLLELDNDELSVFLSLISTSAASEQNEIKKMYMENFAENFGLI